MLLSQTVLPATTVTDIYTVPTYGEVAIEVQNIFVTVTTMYVSTKFRLSLAPGGIADDAAQYLLYDVVIPANGYQLETRIVAQPGDIIRAYASTTDVTVALFGVPVVI